MLDHPQHALVVSSTITLGHLQPGIETTAMHAQNAAHRIDSKFLCVLAHERVLHPDALAKYAAAFFRMSRSSVTRLSSARSRRNSAMSLLSLLTRTPGAGIFSRRIHSYRLCLFTPSRCATSTTE